MPYWVVSKDRRSLPEKFTYEDSAAAWANERLHRGETNLAVVASLGLRDRLCLWAIARAKRTPYYHLDGYMERWWLLRTPWLSIRVHHILRSDADRDPHDHPFDWASYIMFGRYVEASYRPGSDAPAVEEHEAGSFRRRKAEALHRLLLFPNESVWTLFIMGRKRRSWGFQTDKGWVNWRDYHGVTEAQKAADDAAWRGARP